MDCNVLFCTVPAHEGDIHTDITGYSWQEETPDEPTIARIYSWSVG